MSNDPVETFPSTKPSSISQDNQRRAQTAMVRVMRAGSEDIVVGENSSLEGSFETQGSMFVDGNLSRADLKTTMLSIGIAGSVQGSAAVGRAEIAGAFDGNLVVSGEVILRSSAHVVGEIQCGKLITHRGATVRANVSVVEDEAELAEIAEETRPSMRNHRRPMLSNTFLHRVAAFVYGVFFTLGTIGLVSMIAH